jgi:hypothetical protein
LEFGVAWAEAAIAPRMSLMAKSLPWRVAELRKKASRHTFHDTYNLNKLFWL